MPRVVLPHQHVHILPEEPNKVMFDYMTNRPIHGWSAWALLCKFLFFFLIFIEIQLIYNIVLGVPQSGPVLCINDIYSFLCSHPSYAIIGEGNGNPVQYSCLGNPKDRGAWQANPWGCKELDTT